MFGCNRYGNGTVSVIDTWNPSIPKINILDEPQTDICSNTVAYDNGRLSCKYVYTATVLWLINYSIFNIILCYRFSRSIKGATPDRDLELNNNLYLMFGTGDTPQGDN